MTTLLAELRTRFAQLQGEIDRDARKVQELSAALATKKRAMQTIAELIELESGEKPVSAKVTPFPISPGLGANPIAEAVYVYLQARHVAVHYSELTRHVLDGGIEISGKNPSNTLLAHLSRDSRFYRPRRGTYALREWNPNARSVGVRRKKGA